MEPRVQLGDKQIVVGQTVDTRWLGEWYKGTVLKLGPRKNLFEVRESISGESFLIEKGQLKPIDRDLPTHQQLEPGAEVAYYDNDINNWISGTIEDNHAVGMLYISWNKHPGSPDNENWFSLDNVATKLGSGTEDESELASKPSWLDILEENPRFVANEAFRDGMRFPHHLYSFFNKLPSPSQLAEKADNHLIQPRQTSTSMKNHYVTFVPLAAAKKKNRNRHRSVPDQPNHLYNHMAQQRGKLDHTEVPPVFSYLGHTKGIPPHPSSAFYKRMHQSMYLPSPSSLQRTPKALQGVQMKHAKSDILPGAMSHSPTGLSNPTPEPHSYVELTRDHSPSRSRGNVHLQLPLHGQLPRTTSNMSHRPLPGVPSSQAPSTYEIPVPSRHASHTGLNHLPEVSEQTEDSHYTEIEPKALHIESSSPSLVLIELGSSTLLTCQVSGEPPIKYEWERNGRKLTNNNARIAFPSPGMLQLYGITASDAGTYKCTASNEQGTITQLYTLKLTKGSPQKQPSSQDSSELSAEEGETEAVKTSKEEPENLRHDFKEQTPTYDDYPMDLSHPMPQIPTVIVESVQQQHARKEHARVAKKVEERKTKRNRRKRVSTTLHNDMDSYLGGYGADYGAEITDSDLIAPPSIVEPIVESQRHTRKKLRKGFLSSILGAGARLTTSKSAQVLQEMVSSSEQDLEISKSTTALSEEKARNSFLSRGAFDSHEDYEVSSLQSGPEEDHIRNSRAEIRRQVGFSPVRDIIIHPATSENGIDQLTQSSANLSDEDREPLPELDSHIEDEPGETFGRDAQDVTPLQASVEEMDITEDDEGNPVIMEPLRKPANILPASSEDSLDAHPSRESLVSDEASYLSTDRDEHRGGEPPQEAAHYTESVRRLQDSHTAYHEEHFGKKKKSKRKLGRWFRSRLDDKDKERTTI